MNSYEQLYVMECISACLFTRPAASYLASITSFWLRQLETYDTCILKNCYHLVFQIIDD